MGVRTLAAMSAALVACLAKPGPPGGPGPAVPIAWQGGFYGGQLPLGMSTFDAHAVSVGDAVVVLVGCPSNVMSFDLVAPGWTFINLAMISSSASLGAAAFGAIAPTTDMTTFSVVAPGCDVVTVIGDEFSGTYAGDPNMTFDSANPATGAGNCEVTVTTVSDNEAVWAACLTQGTANARAPYTFGTSDGHGDITAYRITTDPVATQETATLDNSGGSYVMAAVAIRPQ